MGSDRHAQFFGKGRQGLGGVVLVGIKQVDLGDLVFLNPALQDFRIAVGRDPFREAAIENPIPALFKGSGMVSHCRIEEGQLLLVVAEMRSPGCRLDHAHGRVAVGRLEQGVIGDELVSQDPDQAHEVSLR